MNEELVKLKLEAEIEKIEAETKHVKQQTATSKRLQTQKISIAAIVVAALVVAWIIGYLQPILTKSLQLAQLQKEVNENESLTNRIKQDELLQQKEFSEKALRNERRQFQEELSKQQGALEQLRKEVKEAKELVTVLEQAANTLNEAQANLDSSDSATSSLKEALATYSKRLAPSEDLGRSIEKLDASLIEFGKSISLAEVQNEIEIANWSRKRGNNGKTWNWGVYVKAPEGVLNKIDYVEYTTHVTFSRGSQDNLIRKILKRETQFEYSASGWGVFNIPVRVFLKDGSIIRKSHLLRFGGADQRR